MPRRVLAAAKKMFAKDAKPVNRLVVIIKVSDANFVLRTEAPFHKKGRHYSTEATELVYKATGINVTSNAVHLEDRFNFQLLDSDNPELINHWHTVIVEWDYVMDSKYLLEQMDLLHDGDIVLMKLEKDEEVGKILAKKLEGK